MQNACVKKMPTCIICTNNVSKSENVEYCAINS